MNLYESMNNYFEKTFKLDEDKKKPMEEARGSYKLAVQKALLDADLQLPDTSPMNKKAQEEAVAKAIDIIRAAKAKTDDKKELEAYNRALMILEHRPTPIAFSSLGAWYSGISMSESRKLKKTKTMKESKNIPDITNPYYRAIKRIVNNDEKATDIVWDWLIRDAEPYGEDPFEDDVKTFERNLRRDISIYLDTADDNGFDTLKNISIVAKALGPGYEDWIFTEGCKRNRKPIGEDLGADIEKYQKYVDYDMKHYGRISNKTQSFIDEAGLQVIKDQYGDYEVTAGHYSEGCKSNHKMSKSFRNRKKTESKHNYFSRKSLKESRRTIKRPTSKKLGEALLDTIGVSKNSEDIEKLQKLIDWDLDNLGYIKDITREKISKYGYKLVKDFNSDTYKVVDKVYPNDYYREGCKSRKARKKLTEEKKDLWDTIYSELTEDGSQYIASETGKPRINKGAGYKYDDQIAVDRAGNIVVKVKEERDLKAAIDIADNHKNEGVTYNISESKYDKKYPYWMTIEIPQENLHESKITEKRWRYQVSDKVAKEFRDAVNADDDDYERVRKAILAVYDDIHDNSNLLDDDDYEDWTEEVKDIDLDDEESAQSELNFELSNLYDFCDNVSIWIGI